uniref:OmpA-like domain-containing protein n=1 Tax=candidate division WOR-3 bacterium TaxID=2052148 RepID=A0A7C4U8S1_UNCW3
MKFITFLFGLIIVLGSIYFAYFYFYKFEKLSAKIDALTQENAVLVSELNEMKKLIPKEEEKKIDNLGIKEEIKKQVEDIDVMEEKNKIQIVLPTTRLFQPGSADVTEEGKLILERVGKILKRINFKTINIEGHTDNSKITGSGRNKYPSNWELSAARAINVLKFFSSEIGIDESKCYISAFSEYRPIADNKTQEGRAKNRRIVISIIFE